MVVIVTQTHDILRHSLWTVVGVVVDPLSVPFVVAQTVGSYTHQKQPTQ